jgi:hypothetical protein
VGRDKEKNPGDILFPKNVPIPIQNLMVSEPRLNIHHHKNLEMYIGKIILI